MRVFLDVGAHEGQTVDEALDPVYAFDLVVAFEPMPEQFARLCARFADEPRVVPYPYGLLDRACSLPVYGSNAGMEASVFATKRDLVGDAATPCIFADASEVVAEFPAGAVLVMKLNCEGSETLILDNLIDSGAIARLHHVLVDFDVRKIPGEEHREADVLARLAAIGFDRYSIADEVMIGETHQERTRAWLAPAMVNA